MTTNKLSVGAHVKVVGAADETFAKRWRDRVGVIFALNANGATGNTRRDPLFGVRDARGREEFFWREELRRV